jgi:hypothetical protein
MAGDRCETFQQHLGLIVWNKLPVHKPTGGSCQIY